MKYKDYAVPDPSQPRRRFRLLRWSLFGLALVGLGFLLHDRLPPCPRCTIPFESPFSFGALSPDGHFLATGKAINPFNAFPNMAGIGPLGRPLAGIGLPPKPLGGLENPIQVWDIGSGKRIGTHLRGIESFNHTFSPKFRFLTAWGGNPENPASLNEHFFLVDLERNEQKRFSGLTGFGSDFSPQENYVMVGDNDVKFLVKTSTGEVVKNFPASIRGWSARFVPDDSLLIYEAQNGDLHIWNTRTSQVMKTLKNAKDPVLSPDGKTLAVKMAGGLNVVDLEKFRILRLRPKPKPNSHLMFSPNGATLTVISRIEGVEFWDVATGNHRHGKLGNRRIPKGNFSSGRFSPDSRYLRVSGNYLT